MTDVVDPTVDPMAVPGAVPPPGMLPSAGSPSGSTRGPATGASYAAGPAADSAGAALPLSALNPFGPPRASLLSQVDTRPDAGMLAARIDALSQFRRAVTPYLPPERLQPLRALAERARQRLTICPDLTVVALAGPTGSGKSSIFNALAGRTISPVGVRRPTTGQPHACVWGDLAQAAPLLDWLRIPAESRFGRESALDSADQVPMRGLVLLDLPDFDSVERDHAAEVERLLGMVDVLVWVVDPQKYADRAVHERYLRRFAEHGEVTAVALNQADLLRPADSGRLLEDLCRLVGEDGLTGVTPMATSAVDLPAGLGQLRAELQRLVTSRRAPWLRLAADVDTVVAALADVVGPPVTPDAADRAAFGELADGLADAAGVPRLAEEAETAYRERARGALGPPLLRWLPRRRARFGPAPEPMPPEARAVATGLAVRVAVRLAVRNVAARAADGLPPPWPEAIWRASRSRLSELPDALARALAARGEPAADRTPPWWRLVAGVQWLAAVLATVGLSWLVVSWMLWAFSLPLSYPTVGPVPVPVLLLAGAVATGAATAALVRPVLTLAARRVRIGARRELRAAVAEVGRDRVVVPVREVLEAYADARASLHTAAGL